MSVVSNEDMQDAAAAAVKPEEPVAQPPAPIEEPVAAPALLEHISHAQASYGRAQIEAKGYGHVIAMLEAELRGAERRASDEIASIEADAQEQIAEIEVVSHRRTARIKEDFIVSQSRLSSRIEDLTESRDMANAQIAAYRQLHPEPKETRNAETPTESDPARTSEAAGDDGQPPEQDTSADTSR